MYESLIEIDKYQLNIWNAKKECVVFNSESWVYVLRHWHCASFVMLKNMKTVSLQSAYMLMNIDRLINCVLTLIFWKVSYKKLLKVCSYVTWYTQNDCNFENSQKLTTDLNLKPEISRTKSLLPTLRLI